MPDMDEVLLAPIERLAPRVEEGLETDADQALAFACLETASVKARAIGSSSWTAESVPPEVSIIVLEAAARGFMNPGGFSRERADQVSFERHEDFARGVFFTPREEDEIRKAANIHSVTYSDSTRTELFRARSDAPRPKTVYAAWGGVGAPVPLWSIEDAPLFLEGD